MNGISKFFSLLYAPLIKFLQTVLPVSPFRTYLKAGEGFKGLMAAINYFVPVSTFIGILEVWVTAMFLYYLYHGLISRIWEANADNVLPGLKTFGGFLMKIFKKLL